MIFSLLYRGIKTLYHFFCHFMKARSFPSPIKAFNRKKERESGLAAVSKQAGNGR